MFNKKNIMFIVFSIFLFIIDIMILNSKFSRYSILTFTISIVVLINGISMILKNRKGYNAYESELKYILNTFDSILVKSNSVPNLDERNIVEVMSMDDLVDAQLEIRKPICYVKQTESCSFILLDEKEAYTYILKSNEEVVSPLEIEIKNLKVKRRNDDGIDSEMLRDIERTTIIKLPNKKSYKVSPVREKVVQQEEIEII